MYISFTGYCETKNYIEKSQRSQRLLIQRLTRNEIFNPLANGSMFNLSMLNFTITI